MKTNFKKQRGYANIGFSSILTIFLTICLVTFAALSILTANSDYKLTQKVAEKTTAYYNADSIAQQILADIDSNLLLLYQNSESKEQYYELVTSDTWSTPELVSQQDAGTLLDYTVSSTSEGDATITFHISVSETQNLEVILQILYPIEDHDVFFQILSWRTDTIEQKSTEEQTLHLFTGENP
ncbi:MAG: hypothetical protein ACI4ES_08885 [Roseburia sp.]